MAEEFGIDFMLNEQIYSYIVVLNALTPENTREYWIMNHESDRVVKMDYFPSRIERSGSEVSSPMIKWKDPDDTHVQTEGWKEKVAYEIAQHDGLDDYIAWHDDHVRGNG